MRADWIPIHMNPKEIGSYLVTTAKGAVMIDRFDGDCWAMCNPQNRRGKYKQHKAWTFMPKAYTEGSAFINETNPDSNVQMIAEPIICLQGNGIDRADLHTDSAEYKMWGNGLALPNALYVMEGIIDAEH